MKFGGTGHREHGLVEAEECGLHKGGNSLLRGVEGTRLRANGGCDVLKAGYGQVLQPNVGFAGQHFQGE